MEEEEGQRDEGWFSCLARGSARAVGAHFANRRHRRDITADDLEELVPGINFQATNPAFHTSQRVLRGIFTVPQLAYWTSNSDAAAHLSQALLCLRPDPHPC